MKTHCSLLLRFVLPFSICFAPAAVLRGQPVNNLFANRTVVVGTNVLVQGSNIGASKESGEPNHADNVGGASVWWSWTAPGPGAATISTEGSNFDTILGVYTGSSVAALTLVANNDDEVGLTSRVVFDVVPGQTYQVAVDGFGGATGSIRLSVVLGPAVQLQPAPAWVLPDPYGVTVYSTNYVGKVVILDFWATWCNPCKAEMPDFVYLQDKYRADGLVIVGADTGWSGDTSEVVRNFLATWTPTINYPIVMANSAMMSAYGGISAIPTTFIIDRQNFIRKKHVGTQSRSTFESQIIPLLYGNTCLACKGGPGGMKLCWPITAQPFTLQYCTNLAAANWSSWPETPVVVNGSNRVSVANTGNPIFFRLRLNY